MKTTTTLTLISIFVISVAGNPCPGNEFCKRNNEAIPCSGFGKCICGECACDKRPNPNQFIYGKYCECNNFSCPRYRHLVCGGPERGVCECGQCNCKEAFTGDNCGNRIPDKRACQKNGVICSGNGNCHYGKCVCDLGYKGRYCEHCVSCPGKCSSLKDCVLCQAFKEPSEEHCKKLTCNLDIKMVERSEEMCIYRDSSDCYVTYSIYGSTIYVEKNRRCLVKIKKD